MSPQGERIAFVRGRGDLVVAEVTEGGELATERTLLEGWAEPEDVTWSPDGRWLAYARDDLDFNSEVYVLAADGSGEPVNVSQHPKADSDPVWSGDGSRLGFLSTRNNGDADVWFAWLTEEDRERTPEDWELLEEREEDDGDEDEAPEEDADTAPESVQIDLERIWERLEQVTSLRGNESDLDVSRDGETFYFVTNRRWRSDYEAEHERFREHHPFGPRLPQAAWTKPVAALANQNSYSNAEIFSHAFSTLDLGPLVGEATFGAGISTGGAGLVDGSFVRLPFRAWYVKATDRNMEHGPAEPDVRVPRRPDDRADREDEQLRRAVEVLLEEIDAGG